MQEKISQIEKDFLNKISSSQTLEELDQLYLELFGKNGVVTLLPKDFPSLSKDELREIGPAFNSLKERLEREISDKRLDIREQSYSKLSEETMDLSKETKVKKRKGYLHPLTKFEKEIADLFGKIGFQQFGAPHIDTDFYNFEVLNIPGEHPARDLWDTLYIDQEVDHHKLLLRTHTSNSQVRAMKEYGTPLRVMIIDRCFRYENLDARHEHTFDQFELVYVDKGLSMANLQYLSEYFLKTVLGEKTQVRLRPKYYPFVEPGVGIDGTCLFCGGQGCTICGGIGWLELGGAGMIHPTVLKNGGIDPEVYSGIAWGPGLERILMLKLGVNDLRLFRSGDLEFLQRVGEKA